MQWEHRQKTWTEVSMNTTYRWWKSTRRDTQHHKSLGRCKSQKQWCATTHLSEWLKLKRATPPNAGGDVEKLDHSHIVTGNVRSHSENQFGSFLKTNK